MESAALCLVPPPRELQRQRIPEHLPKVDVVTEGPIGAEHGADLSAKVRIRQHLPDQPQNRPHHDEAAKTEDQMVKIPAHETQSITDTRHRGHARTQRSMKALTGIQKTTDPIGTGG